MQGTDSHRSSLQDRVVVVTGASGRLGRRMVQRFADAGAVVAAVVRSMEHEPDGVPEHCRGGAFAADVTHEHAVRDCFDRIRGRFGRVDALVHTVGTWEARSLLEMSLEQWESVLRINLGSAFLCMREAVRAMEGWGRIVAFASRQGVDGGVAQQAAYSAAKGGLVRLAESVRDEHPSIAVHLLAPSLILFDGEGNGVQASTLVEKTLELIADPSEDSIPLVLRAYGSG